MQPVPIARITLDDGALAVLPAVDHPHRDMVERAAMSVRWDSARGAYVVLAQAGLTPLDQYLQIITAAATELGEKLVLTDRTDFVDVPDPLRARIQALPPPR